MILEYYYNMPEINYYKKYKRRVKFEKLWSDKQAEFIRNFADKMPRDQLLLNNLVFDENVDTHSWYTQKVANFTKTPFIKCKEPNFYKGTVVASKKLPILPTPFQQRILFVWFEGHRLMYNETVRFIYHFYHSYKFYLTHWNIFRDVLLKSAKDHINKSMNVPVHILDNAIHYACAMFKSAITNMEGGHIKTFRIRCLKKSKKSKILYLCKDDMYEGGFYKSMISDMTVIYDIEFNNLPGDPTLQYDGKGNFYLIVPETIKVTGILDMKQQDKYVGLDAGTRTFLTGMSNKNVIEIAPNLSEVIIKDLVRIDRIKRKKIPNRIKKRYERLLNKKIESRVTDMHWKAINYLTNTYDNIILGKLSTKSIVRKGGNLSKMTKRVAMKMSFYKFTQRLKYMCERKGITLQIVDEAYTSKLCSNCGGYTDVEGSKEYKCNHCGILIDRDVNGAKNIAMRGFILTLLGLINQ